MRATAIAALVALLVVGTPALAADLQVVDACYRPDTNPWARTQVWQSYNWTEGWGYPEQFWPKYMKPAGSLHIILRNNTGSPARLQLDDVDGAALGEVSTDRTRVGRVIWRNIFPREVQPGEWAECILRLRTAPAKDVKLGLSANGSRVEVTVPVTPRKTRIESISFSPKTDHVYVYARNLDNTRPRVKGLRLDGVAARTQVTDGPSGSGLALAEAGLKTPWTWGTYHLVEVLLSDGTTLAYPIRAWDNYFCVGLFGDVTMARATGAVKHGFNSYVAGPVPEVMDPLGLNYVPGKPAGARLRTPTRSGALYYYNKDEPDGADATDARDLPYMDRLGFYAQTEVLARYWEEQYDIDPHTPALLLVDGTYKPLHWYVYGQCCDVFSTDPYVPLGGDQLEYVAHALECARDGSAPNPLVSCMWAINVPDEVKKPRDRAPTPQEERMMVFYSLGSGAKGLFYFADRDGTDGAPTGVSHNKPLWAEIGRINSDVKALAPYLAIGCPAGPAVETKQVWMRTLMCGKNRVVTVVVNKGHSIDYSTPTGVVTHTPAKDVTITIPLPPGFRNAAVQEVVNGKMVPVRSEAHGAAVSLKLDSVDTARAFVVTQR